jgi:hypothetical protein
MWWLFFLDHLTSHLTLSLGMYFAKQPLCDSGLCYLYALGRQVFLAAPAACI